MARASPGRATVPSASRLTVVPLPVLLSASMLLAGCATAPSGDQTRAGLTACPPLPNCVSSGGDAVRTLAPLPYADATAEAQARLRRLLDGWPRATVVAERPGFIAVEFRSAMLGFVDDAEFLFDDAKRVVRYRSGARVGLWDLGVNEKRMREIGRAFAPAPTPAPAR